MGKPDITCEADLNSALKTIDKVCVLFYASWCPFSQRFLPIFEKASKNKDCYARVVIDDDESLAEKYDIEFYPTVLFFDNGKATKRLDGTSGRGLNEDQLSAFLKGCGL
jgi:thiol-disulfide isomerase/thioredoxin